MLRATRVLPGELGALHCGKCHTTWRSATLAGLLIWQDIHTATHPKHTPRVTLTPTEPTIYRPQRGDIPPTNGV
jgi:hypothetical protein